MAHTPIKVDRKEPRFKSLTDLTASVDQLRKRIGELDAEVRELKEQLASKEEAIA